ncbi:MAG: transglycosylase domain-containing protein [Thalassococcus sp.]|uniref:transglycosylase domain-containing protein n=1 Tax=Thalassococcus sp. TaxID=1928858 RepID=UPI001B0C36A4|nr:transglycosylase domain-containing protein [Thalassococcus sp.]MBO6867361.1 transglycosylase domain-containing protein [Thalassococcus sp.]
MRIFLALVLIIISALLFAPTGVPLGVFSDAKVAKVPRDLLTAARFEGLEDYAVTLAIADHVEPRGPGMPQPESFLTLLRGRLLSGREKMAVFALENAYVGGEVYGWESAASFCFAKPPEELTLSDAATLLIQMRSPSIASDNREGDLLARRNAFLDRMAENGYVTADVAEAAITQPLVHCGN